MTVFLTMVGLIIWEVIMAVKGREGSPGMIREESRALGSGYIVSAHLFSASGGEI
jgi:hypothetical protein